MPIYVYEVVLPDGSGGEQFEVIQPMSEAALTKHPETGSPSLLFSNHDFVIEAKANATHKAIAGPVAWYASGNPSPLMIRIRAAATLGSSGASVLPGGSRPRLFS